MKKSILAISALFLSQAALADHSMKSVQDVNPEIARVIKALEKSKNVVCDTEASIQMSANSLVGGDSWRQVSFCFKDPATLAKRREFLNKGGIQIGAYGLNPAAILDVTYTFFNDNQREVPTKQAVLNEISLK